MEADEKIKGIVGEVGLKRNEDKFNSFSVTVGLTLKTGGLTYAQGERLIAEMRKELLGKAMIAEIIPLCPVCEKGFNTMRGMRQHVRLVHEKGKKKVIVKAEKTKATPKKKKRARKKATRNKT